MRTSPWRRIGVVLAIVVLLSVALVPAASASGVAAPAAAGCVYYTVRRGDNLTRIAARYRTTVWALQQQNGIRNADRVYVGQRLRICSAPTPPPPPPPCCQPCPPPKPVPPQPVPSGAWQAKYFNSRDLSGAVVLQRTEAGLSHNWGYGSPAAQVFADNFSARWQRTFSLAAGTYRVTVRSDDGVRVSIDDILVVDAWQVQAATNFSQDVIIGGGNHLVTVEYFEAEGVAEIQFTLVKIG